MMKKAIAIVLIFIFSGAWLYLDCLNRQEKHAAETMHQSLEQYRIEGKKRAAVKSTFENQILSNLSACNDAAEKANGRYMHLVEQLAPHRRKQAMIPQDVVAAAEKTLADARMECQLEYDKRAQEGM